MKYNFKKGSFYYFRQQFAWALLLVFIALPFVHYGENPFLMFNIFEKKFFIFFKQIYPQDFFLIAIFMILLFWTFIIVTYRYGRVFCGWACPQTVFLQFVFKKIDDLIFKKIENKNIQFVVQKVSYLIIAFVVSIWILNYIIGVKTVFFYIQNPSLYPIKYLIFNVVFTIIFFVVFAIIKEKACTIFCPYGRIQGIFLNNDTNHVIYNSERGEPRGKIKKNIDMSVFGSCVDCKLCVKVCPTNIDIRNGNQLECIGCNKCIDVCDNVMESLGKAPNLISYNSIDKIKHNKPFSLNWIDTSLIAASVVPFLVFSFILFSKSNFEVIIKRVPGTTYQLTKEGNYSNLYNIQFINKTDKEYDIRIASPENKNAKISLVGGANTIKKESVNEWVVFVEMPKSEIKNHKKELKLNFVSQEIILTSAKALFFSPITLN